jgi:hypothetical protein
VRLVGYCGWDIHPGLIERDDLGRFLGSVGSSRFGCVGRQSRGLRVSILSQILGDFEGGYLG